MNTRKLRKLILTLCSALLLVSMSVGITVAYLTSQDEVVNTFTVGKVNITLDEADADDSDKDGDTKERDKKNDYHLMPGHKYTKDPTIWIDEDSEEAYLRVKIAVTNAAKLDALFKKHSITAVNISDILVGLDLSLWDVSSSVTNDVRNYIFEYKKTIKGGDDPIEIFSEIDIPDNFDNADVEAIGEETTITITAEAIQVAGFANDRDAAWEAFDAQHPVATTPDTEPEPEDTTQE